MASCLFTIQLQVRLCWYFNFTFPQAIPLIINVEPVKSNGPIVLQSRSICISEKRVKGFNGSATLTELELNL